MLSPNTVNRLAHFFIKSAGVLLLITALAKIFTGVWGHTPILSQHDPILIIPFRFELLGVGVLEAIVAIVCFLTERIRLQLGLIAWLATSFVAYRFGLRLIGVHFCKCLGNIPDALHMSAAAADSVSKIVLVYLLIGSYASLLWLWWKSKKALVPTSPAD